MSKYTEAEIREHRILWIRELERRDPKTQGRGSLTFRNRDCCLGGCVQGGNCGWPACANRQQRRCGRV